MLLVLKAVCLILVWQYQLLISVCTIISLPFYLKNLHSYILYNSTDHSSALNAVVCNLTLM